MIQPIRSNVLIKPFLNEETTMGGLVVPESYRGESDKAEVIAVGNGTKDKPMNFKPGDIVFRVKAWGQPVKENGVTYYLMDSSAILAKE